MTQWTIVCNQDTPPNVAGLAKPSWDCPQANASVVEYQPTYQLLVPPPAAPFDLVEGSGFFFFGFGVVIFGYLLGFAVGQVRKPIRQAS